MEQKQQGRNTGVRRSAQNDDVKQIAAAEVIANLVQTADPSTPLRSGRDDIFFYAAICVFGKFGD